MTRLVPGPLRPDAGSDSSQGLLVEGSASAHLRSEASQSLPSGSLSAIHSRFSVQTPGGLVAPSAENSSPRPLPDAIQQHKNNLMLTPLLSTQQTLTMTIKHKPSKDLSPIKQRALQHRTGITAMSKFMTPSYAAASVLEAALDYALPPSSGVPTLAPSLLADLKASEGHFSSSASHLAGSLTLPEAVPLGAGSDVLFSTEPRMPFLSPTKGKLPVPTLGAFTTVWKDGVSVAESVAKLLSQHSQHEVYSFEVPAHVRTGLDAVKLFCSNQAKPGLIVFCGLNPRAKWYDPYDLVVMPLEKLNQACFFAITETGVTHMFGGVAYELVPHHEWVRDSQLFVVLKKLVLFAKHELFKAFRQWHAAVKRKRFVQHQQALARSLLLLSPTFGPPLLAVRRMTLAATHDTASDWIRRPGPTRGSVRWVPVQPAADTRSSHTIDQPTQADVAAEPPDSPSHEVQQDGGAADGSSLPGSVTNLASTAGDGDGDDAAQQVHKPAGPGSLLQPTDPPFHDLLLRGEVLPAAGLPAQLGGIAGPQELLTLDQFKSARSHAKAQVQESLAQMVMYVAEQVSAVGKVVTAQVDAANAAVTPLTRKEAWERKFIHVSGKEAWQRESPYYASEAARERKEHLAQAGAAREQLRSFVKLTDTMVFCAMYDLARLALAISCQQLFQPRRHGLFSISASIRHIDKADAKAMLQQQAAKQAGSQRLSRQRSRPSTAQSSCDDMDAWLEGAVPVVIQPSCEATISAVTDVVRETLGVVTQTCLGVTSHPSVKDLVKRVLGNSLSTIGLREQKRSVLPSHNTETVGLISHASHVSTMSMAGGAKTGSLLESFKSMLHVATLMDQLEDRLSRQYQHLLDAPQLQPFVHHEKEWALVCSFDSVEYQAANHPPNRLKTNMQLIRDWMEAMARATPVSVYGMMHFDMAGPRAALLPPLVQTYSSMMSGMTSSMITLQKELLAELARHISSLRNRPSELPEFVEYMEAVWPHLDESSYKRQHVKHAQEHLASLYAIIMQAIPGPDDPEPSKTGGVAADGSVEVPRVTISVREARPAHLMWKQVQAEVGRYLEEAAAAADFFQHSSTLMTNHLKNNLLQMESDLLAVMRTLRTGVSTSIEAKSSDVSLDLDTLDGQLKELEELGVRCAAWGKLLPHPAVAQVMHSVEKLLHAARTQLSDRSTLWQVLQRWEATLDAAYNQPASARLTDELLEPLNDALTSLDQQVTRITKLHIDNDISSTTTVTPQEAKLASHYTLVIRAWKDMLAVARQLANEAVKPRHISILLNWLHISRTSLVSSSSSLLCLHDKYPVPSVMQQAQEQANMHPPPTQQDATPPPQPAAPAPKPTLARSVSRSRNAASLAPAPPPPSGPHAGVTLAQLLSMCTESQEGRELAARVVQVSRSEHVLTLKLADAHDHLAAEQLMFAPQRVAGAFVITNADELLEDTAALQQVLQEVRAAPAWGGVMYEYEAMEQLLTRATNVLYAVLACQNLCAFLPALLASPEAKAVCPEVVPLLQPLLGVWRMYTLNAHESPSLLNLFVTMPEVQMLQQSLLKVRDMCKEPILETVRQAYPRACWVPDEIILQAVAVNHTNPGGLPSQLLSTCFQGLATLHVEMVAEQQGQAVVMVAVTGMNGESMELLPEVKLKPKFTLACVLGELEVALRVSLKEHMVQCMQACGQLQADVWVSQFPSQCIVLVDAIVWTQSVSNALSRVAEGDRMALRNLLDQSALRLEGLSQQLRAATSTKTGSGAEVEEAATGSTSGKATGVAPGVVALQALIAAGVSHREVLEGLVANDCSSPGSWEWLQHVRHYWDASYHMLFVAFTQCRLPYGWEYRGYTDAPSDLLLPSCQANLLAAANALQTSPVVNLTLADSQGDGLACVQALCRMVGKAHLVVDLLAHDTATTCARRLQAALATGCWISLQGADKLGLQALSVLGQQLAGMCTAYHEGSTSIRLPCEPGVAELQLPSPWAVVSAPDAPVPTALFVPLSSQQLIIKDAMGQESVRASQLSEMRQRVGRCISLCAPAVCLLLEAGLRCEGLRDACEAARAVECCFKLVTMQLPARPQYLFNVVRVTTLLAAVRQLHHTPHATSKGPSANLGHVSPTKQSKAAAFSSSALDVVDAALRAVLLASAPPDDVQLLSRLITDAATIRTRTPSSSAPDSVPLNAARLHQPSHLGLPPAHVVQDTVAKLLASIPDAAPHWSMSGANAAIKIADDTLGWLSIVNSSRLAVEVGRLTLALSATGSCLLVGPPGAGKTLVWKTLVAAVSSTKDFLGFQSNVMHIFPDALPFPNSAPSQQTLHVGQSGAGWLAQVASAVGLVQRQVPSPQGGGVPQADCPGPEWFVFDGPLGSLAGEAMLTLGMHRSSVFSPQTSSEATVGVPSTSKVIWECSSLAGATPALLSCAPVVCINSSLVDLNASGRSAANQAVALLLNRKTRFPDSPAITRQISKLLTTAIARFEALLLGMRQHDITSKADHHTSANPHPPPVAGTTQLGLEHGDGLLASGVQTLLKLLPQLASTLDTPSEPDAALALLARASLFALFWSFAALPLPPSHRVLINGLLKDAAVASGLQHALPPGDGLVAAYMLDPKTGLWRTWEMTVGALISGRKGVIYPEHCRADGVTRPPWHLYTDPLTGSTALFVPSGMTVALEQVAIYSIRAGCHPLLIGSRGSGRSALLKHLAGTCDVIPRHRSEMVGLTLNPTTRTSDLSHLLKYYTTPGSPKQLRPTLGDHLLLMVEDISAVAQCGGAVAQRAMPDGQLALPCLEWLRQLMDTGSVQVAKTSEQAAYRMELVNVSLAATSTPDYLTQGPHQVNARLWRHMHAIHVHAAMQADSSIHDNLLPSSAHATIPTLTLFSTSRLLASLSHHHLLHLATGPAKVPQLLALGPQGVTVAGSVLGSGLDSLLQCVARLQRLNIIKQDVHLGVNQLNGILTRLSTAASSPKGAESGWGIVEVVHRFMYEVNQELSSCVLQELDRDVLGRVVLQSMGKSLGALLTGKFDADMLALAIPPKPGSVPVDPPKRTAPAPSLPPLGSGVMSISSPITWVGDHQDEEDASWAEMWRDYATSSDGPSMTALRINLIGKISPSNINHLVAAARADVLRQAGQRAVRAALALGDGLDDASAENGARFNKQFSMARRSIKASRKLSLPGITGTTQPWPVWLRAPPVNPDQLVQWLEGIIENSDLMKNTNSRGFSLHHLPTEDRPGSASQAAAAQVVGGGRPATLRIPALRLPAGSMSDDESDDGHLTRRIRFLDALAFDSTDAQLCLDILCDCQLGSTLAACACVLSDTPQHVVLTGPDHVALVYLAQMAAISAGTHVLTLAHGKAGDLVEQQDVQGSENLGRGQPSSSRAVLWDLVCELCDMEDGKADRTLKTVKSGGSCRSPPISPAKRVVPPAAGSTSDRYTLVIDDGAASDTDCLELLQMLVACPAQAPLPVCPDYPDLHLEHELVQQLHHFVSNSTSSPHGKKPQSSPTTTANKSSTHAVAVALDGLRRLSEIRCAHQAGQPNLAGAQYPSDLATPAGAAPPSLERTPSFSSNQSQDALLNRSVSPRRSAMVSTRVQQLSMQLNSMSPLERLQADRWAQQLVHAKQAEQQKRMAAIRSISRRLQQCLHVVLAVSPETALKLQNSYPQLSQKLLHIAVPELNHAVQEQFVVQHIQAVASQQEDSLLKTHQYTPPSHKIDTDEAPEPGQTPAALFAAHCVASGEEQGQNKEYDALPASEPAAGQEQVGSKPAAAPVRAALQASSQGGAAGPAVIGNQLLAQESSRFLGGTIKGSMARSNTLLLGRSGTMDQMTAGIEVEAKRAAGLVQVLLEVHQQAELGAQQQGMLAAGNRLPYTMVSDVVDMLVYMHGAQCKALKARQAELWMALQRLSPQACHVAIDTQDMPVLQDAIEKRSVHLANAKQKLSVLNEYETRLETELAHQEQLVAKHRAVVYEVTAEIDAALELANRRYRQAQQEVGGLTESDLAELKSYTNPPERVRLVMMAVTALFEAPPDWRSAQKLLGEQNPKLLERLVNFDMNSISIMALAKLARIVSEPEFNTVQVAQVSKAAKPLCWWALCVHEMLKVGREADLKRMKIVEAEERLEEATKYARQLKGELMTARNESARRQAAHDAAEADIAEMQAIISDHEKALSNASRLNETTTALRAAWEEQLKVVQVQLGPALGDATLACLATVYLGYLLPNQRQAQLHAWTRLLSSHSLPVTSDFILSRFLSARKEQVLSEMSPADRASFPAAWLDVIQMATSSWHVPLILDPGRELEAILRANHKTLDSHRDGAITAPAQAVQHFSTLDKDLASKVSRAVSAGQTVVVDLSSGSSDEMSRVLRALVAYRKVHEIKYPDLTNPQHHLFLRLRQRNVALLGSWYRWVCPLRLGWDEDLLRSCLKDALLSLHSPDAAQLLKETRNRVQELQLECEKLSDAVVHNVAHSRGAVYSDQVLVDTTCAWAQKALEAMDSLPGLKQELQDLEANCLPAAHVALLDAAQLVYEGLAYLAAHQAGRVCMPAHLFVHVFKAAAEEVLAQGWEHITSLCHGRHELDAALDQVPASQPAATVAATAPSMQLPVSEGVQRLGRYGTATCSSSGEVLGEAGQQLHNAPRDHHVQTPSLGQSPLGRLPHPNVPLKHSLTHGLYDTINNLLQLLSCCMTSAQAEVLRLLVALRVLHMRGDISAAELQFITTFIREGPPQLDPNGPGSPQGKGQISSQPSQVSLGQPTASSGSTARVNCTPLAAQNSTGLAAVRSETSLAPENTQTSLSSMLPPTAGEAAVLPLLGWLERSYPGGAFQGLFRSMQSEPKAWQQALTADDLSVPLITALTLPPVRPTQAQPLTLATPADLASLTTLAAAIAAKRDVDTPGSPDKLGTPLGLPGQNSATTLPGMPSAASIMSPVASPIHKHPRRAAGPTAPQGDLPQHWAQTRLVSPAHWFLLSALLGPNTRLAPASSWLSSYVLNRGLAPHDPTPGERLLQTAVVAPAACATLLVSTCAEAAIAAVRQAAVSWSSGVTGMWRPRDQEASGEQDVQVLSWGSHTWPELRQLIKNAMHLDKWLLLLNCHTAYNNELLELLNWLSSHEYLVRGEDVAFRLFISMPYPVLSSLPPMALNQGLTAVLQPVQSLATAARSSMVTLAHSSASYVGMFSKSYDPELSILILAGILAVATVEHTCRPVEVSTAALFSDWDLLHGLHLIRLMLLEARKQDASMMDSQGLDFLRLKQVLLADVFQPACPAPHLAMHIQAILTNLLAPNLLAADHPVHRLAHDKDSDAADDLLPATTPWPYNARNLVNVLTALDDLLDTRAATLSSLAPGAGCVALGIPKGQRMQQTGQTSQPRTSMLGNFLAAAKRLMGVDDEDGLAVPTSEELLALEQSLACQGPWPLASLLKYCSSLSAAHAGQASKQSRLVLAHLVMQPPWTAPGYPNPHAFRGDRVMKLRPGLTIPGSSHPARAGHMADLTAEVAAECSTPGSVYAGHPGPQTPTSVHGGTPRDRAGTAGTHQQPVSNRVWQADACALVPMPRAAPPTAACGAVLQELHVWVIQHAGTVAQLLAWAHTRLMAGISRPRALIGALESHLLEVIQQEAHLTLADLLAVARGCAFLRTADSDTTLRTPATNMALAQFAAGLMPTAWQHATQMASSLQGHRQLVIDQPCTIQIWQRQVIQRSEALQGMMHALDKPAAGVGQEETFPALPLHLFHLPMTPISVVMRAYACEHNVQLSHLCVRAMPVSSPPGGYPAIASPNPVFSGRTSSPDVAHSKQARQLLPRLGLRVSGLHIRDGSLKAVEDMLHGPPWTQDEVLLLEDAPSDQAITSVETLRLIPALVELRTRSTHVSRSGSRPQSNTAPRGLSSIAGPATVMPGTPSSAGTADTRYGAVPLVLPVAMSPSGAVLEEATAALQVWVRQGVGASTPARPFGGAALMGYTNPVAPVQARGLCFVTGSSTDIADTCSLTPAQLRAAACTDF